MINPNLRPQQRIQRTQSFTLPTDKMAPLVLVLDTKNTPVTTVAPIQLATALGKILFVLNKIIPSDQHGAYAIKLRRTPIIQIVWRDVSGWIVWSITATPQQRRELGQECWKDIQEFVSQELSFLKQYATFLSDTERGVWSCPPEDAARKRVGNLMFDAQYENELLVKFDRLDAAERTRALEAIAAKERSISQLDASIAKRDAHISDTEARLALIRLTDEAARTRVMREQITVTV